MAEVASSGKRVTALSRIDQERLAVGEISYPEEALKQYEDPPLPAPLPQVPKDHGGEGSNGGVRRRHISPREREILENLPPHFGKI